MNVRVVAARVIEKIMIHGRSLSDCLPVGQAELTEERDQALLQALCYGVCRRFFYLSALLDLLLEKPFKEKDEDLYTLLLVGLYQLIDMRIPAYAAVAETVAATTLLDKVWAKGLVNAILRNYQRHATELEMDLQQNLAAYYAHPTWFIGMLQKAWPEQWKSILTENNFHPPFALRVNQRLCSRESYLEKLASANIDATPISETLSGVLLSKAINVELLPGFHAGEISVQDGAAQLAAELLLLTPGLRVLDACAAPGGKTAHIAELEPQLAELIAIDCDLERLKRVKENLARLKLTATCLHNDATAVAQWWDGQLFDRILLDSPCSASGVIRRHPDIKLLRRPEDIQHLVSEQLHLLSALWPLLKTNGILLYVTCSVLPRENSGVITQFLATHPDAKEEIIESEWGQKVAIGKQILPGMHGMDGFYFARLRKM
jgi:16S rRNA (cytosine967-C5)-methyltransferase